MSMGTNATQRCPLCKKKQSEFNGIHLDEKFEIEDWAKDLGLCLLHFGINTATFLLHAAYNMGNE